MNLPIDTNIIIFWGDEDRYLDKLDLYIPIREFEKMSHPWLCILYKEYYCKRNIVFLDQLPEVPLIRLLSFYDMQEQILSDILKIEMRILLPKMI